MDKIEKQLRIALAAMVSRATVDDRAYGIAALRLSMGLLVPHKPWSEVTAKDLNAPSIDEVMRAIQEISL